MANLKEIRTRLQSVHSTRKITSAMKMVSAAKFHKAQETILRFEPYSRKMFEVLSQAFSGGSDDPETDKWFKECGGCKKAALIVITSNSSMCGAFNQNVVKKVLEDGPNIFSGKLNTDAVDLFFIGKKGADILSKKGSKIHSLDTKIIEKPNFSSASKYSEMLMDHFLNRTYDKIFVAFNQYKNPAVQIPVIEQFLPISFPKSINQQRINQDVIFEPDRLSIVKTIIPKALKIKFFSYLLEVSAGEHGARMTAMHQATDNATDLINQLTTQYNKARQASITKEILEIVSGAEALRG